MTFFASRRKTYDNYRAGDPPAQCVSAEDPIDVPSEQLFEEDIDRDFLESLDDIVDAYANDRDFLEASAGADEHPPLPFEFTRVFFAHPEKKRRRAKLNKTITAQLMWQAKHSITNAAMKDFVAMARAPWFNSSELRSGNTLRRTREYFPLLPLYLFNVKTDELPYYNDKGVYVEESSKKIPFFSIVDVTTRFLQTPGIIDSITVGAELGPVCKEQCHGRQSRESPHFTYDRIQTEIRVGEAWELGKTQADPGEMPAGPRTGVGIVVVQNIYKVDNNTALLRVYWLGRVSILEVTGCYSYQIRSAARFPVLIFAHRLRRRVHVIQHGAALLLNAFFIK